MNAETGAEVLGNDAEPRQRLTRALAAESRNALARVSLATSEMARFDGPPRWQEMIGTIQEAVRDIDGLLDTIGGLAAPLPNPPDPAAAEGDFGTGLAEALARIEPILLARGITIHVQPFSQEPLPSRLPAPVLTRLLMAFLRLGLSRTDRGVVVQLIGEADEGLVSLHWGPAPGSASGDAPAAPADSFVSASLLEVEAQWAQWGGWIECEAEPNRLRLCWPLPGWENGLDRGARAGSEGSSGGSSHV